MDKTALAPWILATREVGDASHRAMPTPTGSMRQRDSDMSRQLLCMFVLSCAGGEIMVKKDVPDFERFEASKHQTWESANQKKNVQSGQQAEHSSTCTTPERDRLCTLSCTCRKCGALRASSAVWKCTNMTLLPVEGWTLLLGQLSGLGRCRCPRRDQCQQRR